MGTGRFFAALLTTVLTAATAFAAPPPATLLTAAERGDQALARTLLQQGADVNAAGGDGSTPLHRAVFSDHFDIATLLVKAGAKVAVTDRYGVTPLALACLNGNAKMIRLLIEAGADPATVDSAGEPALMTAARTGVPDALRALLDAGAKVDARDTQFQQTSLMIAVRENQVEAVDFLISRHAAVDAQTRKGPLPPFVKPCKGTGCGSEGVGINRGGLPDRGRRAEAKGGMTPLLYAARDDRAGRARLPRR